jgi:hypothetical protein
MERNRLKEAIDRLGWMSAIEIKHPPKARSDRSRRLRLWKRDREPDADTGVPVRPGLALVVVLGAIFAGTIIVSRILLIQRFAACIS